MKLTNKLAFLHVYVWWSFWLSFMAYKAMGTSYAVFLGIIVCISIKSWIDISKKENIYLFEYFCDAIFCMLGGLLALMI